MFGIGGEIDGYCNSNGYFGVCYILSLVWLVDGLVCWIDYEIVFDVDCDYDGCFDDIDNECYGE